MMTIVLLIFSPLLIAASRDVFVCLFFSFFYSLFFCKLNGFLSPNARICTAFIVKLLSSSGNVPMDLITRQFSSVALV